MKGGRMRAALIGTLLTGVFMGAAINNIASAPLGLIADDFATSPARITLVVGASGFALACCMPVAGWLSVRWGSRRILIGAFVLLGLACLVAGSASTVWLLVLARVAQGVAMSVVPPTVMYALPELLGGQRRERALGWWAVANGAGTALGAPLGALIADTLGWRAMFLVFVPVCFVLAVACYWLRADAERQRPLDVGGAVLLTVALAFVITPLMASGVGLPGLALGLIGAVGAGASVLFVRRLRTAEAPFVAPRFLRSPAFVVGSLGVAGQMFILGSASVLVPLVTVEVYGFSVAVAGTFVLVVTVTMMLLAAPVSGLVPRYGARRLILAGLTLTAAAVTGVAATAAIGAVIPAVVGCLLLLGVGLALLQSPSAIMVSAQPSSRGAGVGLFNSLRFAGGVVGASWLSIAALAGADASQALYLTGIPVLLAGVVVGIVRPTPGG